MVILASEPDPMLIFQPKSNSSRIILPELEKSLDDTDVITKLFKRRKDDMKVKYGKFCINQPKAEFILTEFDAFFNVSTISYSKIQHTFLI